MKAKCINVPYINQAVEWPTGCESVSTVMLLQYLGLNIDVDTWIGYLPKVPLKSFGDTMIGGDPNKHFIGSPYDADSFGCYAPVIADTLNRLFESKQTVLRAVDVTDVSTEELIETYINNDMPVIYWATIDLKPSYKGPYWLLYDTGRMFEWTSNEHCMLLTGYDENHLIFNDPWNNHGVIAYDRALVEMRHKEMFSMAVAVERMS